MLHENELERYRKQLQLPEWGPQQQMRWKNAHVLVVGAGGLGSAALPYLAAAGIGKLDIMDGDVLERSNLARQVIYHDAQIGQCKAQLAAQHLQAINPDILIRAIPSYLNAGNAYECLAEVDLVLDCSDNFDTRYLINDVCVQLDKPFVYAAIHAWEGLLSVCNAWVHGENRKGPTYRCLFPAEPSKAEVPNCEAIGVMGVLPGLLGVLQAKEALFYLADWPSPANGALFTWDMRQMQGRSFRLQRLPEAEHLAKNQRLEDKDLSPAQALDWWQSSGVPCIDVREAWEWDLVHLPQSRHLPLGQLLAQGPDWEGDALILCHHGIRSAQAIAYLKSLGHQGRLAHVRGGIDAWAKALDPQLPRY